jgi:preflagellin peptidase FlaK
VEALDAVRFVVGAAFLAFAAASDLRMRRVADAVWIALGGIGLALLGGELGLEAAPWYAYVLLLPLAVLFYGVFFGEPMFGEEGFRLRPFRTVAYLAALVTLLAAVAAATDQGNVGPLVPLLVALVLVVVGHSLYYVGLLRGGADAKAFMTVALLVPVYPRLAPTIPLLQYPAALEATLSVGFPFAFVVLLNASLLLLVLPLYFLLRNLVRGDLQAPPCFFGYRVSVDRVPPFAWLMERVEDGEAVLVLFPRRGDDMAMEIERLRRLGRRRVWITPKLPFLVPFAFGFVLAFLVGNLLFALLQPFI